MKNKKLILLENRLRRLLKENPIKGKYGVSGVNNDQTREIQNYIIDNFSDYKNYLGTKNPNDGFWGIKTDETILRLIDDLTKKNPELNKKI